MAKKPNRQEQQTWQQKTDHLAGIVRDPKTGIVLARTIRHPLADLFMSAPMGQGLPALNIHPFNEISQILAIHMFDNLDCSPPRDPKYKWRPNNAQVRATGLPGVLWVPINTPDPEPTVAAEPVEVADISEYSTEQLAVLKSQIRQVEIRQKLINNLDPHVDLDAGKPK